MKKNYFINSSIKQETEYLKIYFLHTEERLYKIIFTKRKANKRVKIHCTGNQIIWEHMYPLGRSPLSVKTNICQPSSVIDVKMFCVFVISGKPDIICGLDDGIFSSVRMINVNRNTNTNKLYVMSEVAFNQYLLPTIENSTLIKHKT
jgi:hypothetical protein